MQVYMDYKAGREPRADRFALLREAAGQNAAEAAKRDRDVNSE